ncbi:MAG: PaaI family thioesterase [Ignavibacteria bacterium]|nr:PaaI family thioesterase [Ignavibacteria bacterium]
MKTQTPPPFKVKNDNYRETILNHLFKQHFMQLIGCKLTKIEPGLVIAEMDIGKEHEQQIGLIHGGVTASIADVAAGFAGFTLVGLNEHTVTAEIKVSYLNKGFGGRLKAIGRVVKAGRSFMFCEADVFNLHGDTETLIARATTTIAVITPRQ